MLSLILVELIVETLPQKYVEKLIVIIAGHLESSRHLEFYLLWAQNLLTIHGPSIKGHQSLPALLTLEKSLKRKYEQLSKM